MKKLLIFTFAFLLIFIFIIGTVYIVQGQNIKRLYPVKSTEEIGSEFIKKNSVKYYVEKLYVISGIELYRGNGKYVKQNGENYSYLDDEFINKYKIQPDLSFWQRYGFVSLIIVYFSTCIYYWRSNNSNKSNNGSGDVDIDIPDEKVHSDNVNIV